jgi:hypothetical protein
LNENYDEKTQGPKIDSSNNYWKTDRRVARLNKRLARSEFGSNKFNRILNRIQTTYDNNADSKGFDPNARYGDNTANKIFAYKNATKDFDALSNKDTSGFTDEQLESHNKDLDAAKEKLTTIGNGIKAEWNPSDPSKEKKVTDENLAEVGKSTGVVGTAPDDNDEKTQQLMNMAATGLRSYNKSQASKATQVGGAKAINNIWNGLFGRQGIKLPEPNVYYTLGFRYGGVVKGLFGLSGLVTKGMGMVNKFKGMMAASKSGASGIVSEGLGAIGNLAGGKNRIQGTGSAIADKAADLVGMIPG